MTAAVVPVRLIVARAGPMCPPDMFTFFLVVHAIIAASLVTVILMQRSEGGGLGMGVARRD